MNEPPFMLDGARVVEFAIFAAPTEGAARTSTFFGGVPVHLEDVAGVAIAEDLVAEGVFLLLCNDEWTCLTAARFGDVAGARASAEDAFPALSSHWSVYRDLTDEERKEFETTRAFLRELAEQYPDA